MMNNKLIFVNIKEKDANFNVSVSMESFWHLDNPENLLQKISLLYKKTISEMRIVNNQMDTFRNKRKSPPARLAWILGDKIFQMINDLKEMGFQIDDLYLHLERDLKVKRKWLEKVIILRRHLPAKELIPSTASWSMFEKGTRKKAQDLNNENKRD